MLQSWMRAIDDGRFQRFNLKDDLTSCFYGAGCVTAKWKCYPTRDLWIQGKINPLMGYVIFARFFHFSGMVESLWNLSETWILRELGIFMYFVNVEPLEQSSVLRSVVSCVNISVGIGNTSMPCKIGTCTYHVWNTLSAVAYSISAHWLWIMIDW